MTFRRKSKEQLRKEVLTDIRKRITKSRAYYKKIGKKATWQSELLTATYLLQEKKSIFYSEDEKLSKLTCTLETLVNSCIWGELAPKEVYYHASFYAKELYSKGREET